MIVPFCIYTQKCEQCGKLFDMREKEYIITIPDEKIAKCVCSKECAEKYKEKIIKRKKNEYLKVKKGIKVQAVIYEEGVE